MTSRCHHQPACPGCPHFGSESIAPAARHRLEVLAREAPGARLRFGSGPGLGTRHRVRLSVRQGSEGPRVGIFERGTHRLVHIPDCPLHHPSIVEVTAELLSLCRELGLSAYREDTHSGLLRTVQLAVERPSAQVQVVLVLCADRQRQVAGWGSSLAVAERLSAHPRVHSVFLNFQPRRTNTLLGPHFLHLHGPEHMRDRSGNAEIFFPPGAFGQANPVAHDRAVRRIHSWVSSGPVIEYYAGVGTIGLGLARRGQEVVFNEMGEHSLAGLKKGIERLPSSVRCQVLQGPAKDHTDALRDAEGRTTVIVDPPRKGLDPELLAGLQRSAPAQLIYLSCGLDSFERDARALLAAGYKLIEMEGLPYFPFTDHVETLSRWEPPVPQKDREASEETTSMSGNGGRASSTGPC